MKFSITADHIARGTVDSGNCPVALAIMADGWNGWKGIRVSEDYIAIGRANYKTPREVAEFIARFDAPGGREGVKPLEFELPI